MLECWDGMCMANICSLGWMSARQGQPQEVPAVVRSTKPIPVAERNEHVTNVAQRVQAALWTAEPGQQDELRRTWPRLADALAALDETLQTPVIKRGARASEQ